MLMIWQMLFICIKKMNPKSNHAPNDEQGNPILVLNVGCGSDISIKDLANMISDEIGFKGQIIWDSSKRRMMKNR